VTGLVLWDFDGTLAERPGMWRACLIETLDADEPGHSVSTAALIPFLRDGFPWHRPGDPHPQLCTREAWWNTVGELLARAYEGVGIEPARAAELAALARKRYVDPAVGWRLFDDTVPALESLAARGWRHVVLSNHVPELDAIVDGLRLSQLVERVFSSAVTGYEKPHPGAFASALRDRRDSETVWMVGDNPEADVEGARRAGLEAILVRSNGVGLLDAADRILAS
jgi:HAD superfamily hydrolase (TIGR01549 family)